MQSSSSPQKKLKSPVSEITNYRTSITCQNVPESLFETNAAKKHFSKFGSVQRIRLCPKRHRCIVEYDQPLAAETAVLNAGAFDGVMFDVTRTKSRIRRRSKKEDDPEWVPDSEVEEELSAMSGAPSYMLTRRNVMDVDKEMDKIKYSARKILKQPIVRKAVAITPRRTSIAKKGSIESPAVVASTQTSLSTAEAASELIQLNCKVCLSPDEQWRVLDARDRILRAWGGTGARMKIGGATIGTCPDKCPEKERLHRQAEHQVMTLETVPESDGQLEMWRAVKQYSRSSADQEIPMCYELRSASVLMRTCAYLLHEIADTKRQVTLADWFHFMWDRFRGIRKDITQQALCCADSIKLVEICARFHAHCAARLADLEHTQFDQKLNTDNLTKCLQTLKHMYADVGPELKPKEAEFRGYIALLNLGDANFWWEIKQLPQNIQKSNAITFAIQIFNALDNNNYVRFFRLINQNATYLQACILLRYFNDVRARALARIVKAFAPRGGSRYPAVDLINSLCFETIDSMQSFISHYGLRISKIDDVELSIILDRNHFIEDSDPYPLSRAVQLIESKRQNTVGEIIAGGILPPHDFGDYSVYSSFTTNGSLKETSLTAEDQGFNTFNDTNKDMQGLKLELRRLLQGGRNERTAEVHAETKNTFVKPMVIPRPPIMANESNTLFSFKPAIPIASADVIKGSSEKLFQDTKNTFSFSKPDETVTPKQIKLKNSFDSAKLNANLSGNLFSNYKNNKFIKSDGISNVEKKSIFSTANDKIDKMNDTLENKTSQNIFGNFNKNIASTDSNIFIKSNAKSNKIFGANENRILSPGSLFKTANQVNVPDTTYTIFQSKNKPSSVANNIFQSVNSTKNIYEFDSHDMNSEKISELQQLDEERMKQEKIKQEESKRLDIKRKEEEQRQEENRKKEEERKKLEELKSLEENRRREEERKQEELRRKIKEEKKKAEERKLLIEKECTEVLEELVQEVSFNTVENIMKEESDKFKYLMSLANNLTDELIKETCYVMSHSEVKAIQKWIKKLWKKYFHLWRNNVGRNIKRRILLEDVPTWLTETPIETAAHLRRRSENVALTNMNAFHRGYRFTGELKHFPIPGSFNIMEIIKTPLLKRMRSINYPYDKCFFWKVTLVSEGWLYKKIDITKWLLDAFGDKKHHDVSESLIHVSKNSWNNLMDFAISVSMTNGDSKTCSEAIEGTNGVLYYITESNLIAIKDLIKSTLKQKYPYQLLPVAILIQNLDDFNINLLQEFLMENVKDNMISAYKLFIVGKDNLSNSLIRVTKSALKWLAKKCPQNPPLETDYLKSICERYLGNEFWHKIKYERDGRIKMVIKDLPTLVKCYNLAVDKLIDVVTDEDLFNYSNFPLEFKQYLNDRSPYPKPYEFIESNAKNSGNVSTIKDIMQQMKLPVPISGFNTNDANSKLDRIQNYCNQIGWHTTEDSKEVIAKVVALLSNQSSDIVMPRKQLSDYLKCYDLTELLNIIIYEKINKLKRYDKLFALYEKNVLQNYCTMDWLYKSDVITSMKHKIVECEDDIDYFIEAKRQRKAIESMEYLDLEEQDITQVKNNIEAVNESICEYTNCQDTVDTLEQQIEEGQKKSLYLENLLRCALSED